MGIGVRKKRQYRIGSLGFCDFTSQYSSDCEAKFSFKEAKVFPQNLITAKTQPDCMMFRLLLGLLQEKNPDAFQLTEPLYKLTVIVDLCDSENKLDAGKAESIRRKIFTKGFGVIFDDGTSAHYYMALSSASMMRKGQAVFIHDRYYGALMDRVTMGLQRDKEILLPDKSEIALSKWMAYCGLALSGGSPCPLELNCCNVIVVPDLIYDMDYCGEVFTAGEAKKDASTKLKVNLTDGEGLVTPEMALEINGYLDLVDDDAASSFQIRMPFVKGVLHSVDFHDYFRSCGVTQLMDICGNLHNVDKLQVILTESMFKGSHWFEAAGKANGVDAVSEYFRRFGEKKNGENIYCLYVLKTNERVDRQTRNPRLNYQVLHTAGMAVENFVDLCRNCLDIYYRPLLDDENSQLAYFYDKAMQVKDGTDEVEYEDADASYVSAVYDALYLNIWRALEKNSELLRTARIKDIVKSEAEKVLSRLQCGQIPVSNGTVRWLSGDIMEMLYFLASKSGFPKYLGEKPQFLGSADFYAPGFSSNGDCCAFFRNPHISRNEHVLLKQYYPDKVRKKYLGHLVGTVMISSREMAAMRLGGADFDGDIAQVVDDIRYVNALKKSLLVGPVPKKSSELPLIVIPSAPAKTCLVKSLNEDEMLLKAGFEIFKFSMNSKVGLFSHYAFIHGVEAFGYSENDEKKKLVNHLTVYTGQEIDSAKTGISPDITKPVCGEAGKEYTVMANRKEPFWEFKNGADIPKAYPENRYPISHKIKAEEDVAKGALDELRCNTNLLPIYLQKVKPRRASKTRLSLPELFAPGCHELESADPSLYAEAFQSLSTFYTRCANRIQSTSRSSSGSERLSNGENPARRILSKRYGSDDFIRVYSDCLNAFCKLDREKLNRIWKGLYGRNYELLPEDERLPVLTDVLSDEEVVLPESIAAEFTNFGNGGFALVYCALNYAMASAGPVTVAKAMEPWQEKLHACQSIPELDKAAIQRARELCQGSNGLILACCLNLINDKGTGENFFWHICGSFAHEYLGGTKVSVTECGSGETGAVRLGAKWYLVEKDGDICAE